VYVIEAAGPGLTVRLADWEATLDTSVKGPASFVLRGSGADRRVTIVDADGGAVDLVTRPVASRGAMVVRRLRAALAAPRAV